MVSGKMFRPLAFAYSWRASLVEWGVFMRKFWGNFIGAGILMGSVGIAVLWRRYKPLVVSWGLMMIAHSLFYINYRAVDKELMFLPVYLLWSLFISVGCAYIFRQADRVTQIRWLVKGVWILPAIMLILNYGYADVSWDRRARENAQAALDGSEANALIIGWWTDVTPIQYLQYVEGQRPDVAVINRMMITPENLQQMVEQQIDHRPVYLLGNDPILTNRYDAKVTPHGLLLLTR
jgi:hypothetical protein